MYSFVFITLHADVIEIRYGNARWKQYFTNFTCLRCSFDSLFLYFLNELCQQNNSEIRTHNFLLYARFKSKKEVLNILVEAISLFELIILNFIIFATFSKYMISMISFQRKT